MVMSDSESSVEKYLNKRVKQLGGFTRKYISPEHVGVADRICFFPGGKVYFVEVKTDEGKQTSRQRRERERMLSLGQNADVIYGKSGVDQWSCCVSDTIEDQQVNNIMSDEIKAAKEEIIIKAHSDMQIYFDELLDEYSEEHSNIIARASIVSVDLTGRLRYKKTRQCLQYAADLAVAVAKAAMKKEIEELSVNYLLLMEKANGYMFLFPDIIKIIRKKKDYVSAIITDRLHDYNNGNNRGIRE